MISLTAQAESFPLARVFTISRGSRTEAHVVSVTLSDGTAQGRGECVPYARYGETVDSVLDQINSQAAALAGGMDRAALQTALPPGAARNALDCALWDLEAKRTGVPVWKRAGLDEPGPEITVYTLSLDTPDAMQAQAAENASRPVLKVKLGGEGDIDRIRAVRTGAPDARIVIDANEGWTAAQYSEIAPVLVDLGVAMVEQPLPAGDDAALASLDRPLPVCADEACHDRASLPALTGKYDIVDIKLDKTGGLTEALALRSAALDRGFGVMVGCMVGTSLAMAPALLVAQGAVVTDLDGPLLLANDRTPGMVFDAAGVHPADRQLWG